MSNYIKSAIKLFEKHDSEKISIISKSQKYEIDMTVFQLPHLLGIHYINTHNNKQNAGGLIRYVKSKKVKDNTVTNRIRQTRPSKYEDVRLRINNLEQFFYNIEKSCIKEVTHEDTSIKSHHTLSISNEDYIEQLGIGSTAEVEYLETFIVRKDDSYTKNSSINEPILSLSKYDKDYNLKPFSFDEETNNLLKDMNYELDEEQLKRIFKEVDLEELESASFYFKNLKMIALPSHSEIGLNDLKERKYMEDPLRKSNFKNEVPEAFKDNKMFFCLNSRSLYTKEGIKSLDYTDKSLVAYLKLAFKEIITQKVVKEEKSLSSLNKELMHDKDFIKKILKGKPDCINELPDDILQNKSFMKFVTKDNNSMSHANERTKRIIKGGDEKSR